jgi:hypothetical protein
MLILSSAVASRYYICCIDGSISPGNDGYLFMFVALEVLLAYIGIIQEECSDLAWKNTFFHFISLPISLSTLRITVTRPIFRERQNVTFELHLKPFAIKVAANLAANSSEPVYI